MTSINKKASGKTVRVLNPTIIAPIAKNKYKVPVKLWKSFGEGGSIYNDLMDTCLDLQGLIKHHRTNEIPSKQWETLCHNMACYAAWSVNKELQ